MAEITEQKNYVKTGDDYKESLRDGRQVYYQGELVEDITTHPVMKGGVNTLAEMFDAQHDPHGQDILTQVREEDGARVTAAYLVPRTKEDLRFRREGIEHIARLNFGFYGRGMDMIATLPVGMIAQYPSFQRGCPEFADNMFSYRKHCEENNIHLAETIVDPQGYRARAGGTPPDTQPPERAAARITKQNSEGVWISGLKAVGTAAPYCNEVMVGSFHPPLADESFWIAIPINTPGLKVFCRERVHQPGTSVDAHPINARGEEFESLLAYDDVFVPNDRIISLRTPEHHSVNFYNLWAQHEHWYTMVRITAKAQLYAGLTQMVVDTLELGNIPIVRQRVAEVFEWAQILRGMSIACEELAELSEGDVMTPHMPTVTAARSYALDGLPRIYHIIQDLCGQGLMLRFSDEDLATNAAFGKPLSWFLDTQQMSAKEKNMVMNLVWDTTASGNAARIKMFEESNALNVPFLKERLFGEFDRSHAVNDCRHFLGWGDIAEKRTYVPRLRPAWHSEKLDVGMDVDTEQDVMG